VEFEVEKIDAMIYTIRQQRVMLDSDLAMLYGVETKVLNQAVRRNLKRFPGDFMFQLTPDEYKVLKSQFVTSKLGSGGKQKQPLVFTENGVAMLSGIINSDRAISVNITIMRTFTKLRSFLAMESSLKDEVNQLKGDTNHLFKIVFEKLDNLEVQVIPKLPPNRKKIGLKLSL
jgi:hypothetical protein